MKALKIIFLVVIVIIVLGGVGAWLFVKNFDLNKYKPQIVEQASKAFGRPVQIGDLKLNLSAAQGVALGVSGFSVEDLPAFQQGKLLQVESVQVGVDVQHWLQTKEVRVTKILIHKPVLNLVKNEQGQLNLESLGKSEKAPAGDVSGVSAPSTTSPSAASVSQPIPKFVVNQIAITEGSIAILDRSPGGVSLQVQPYQLTVNNFTLGQPFQVDLKAAVLSGSPNIQVTGWVTLDEAKQAATLKDIHFSTDLALFKLSEVEKLLLSFGTGASLPKEWAGQLSVSIPGAVVGAKGLEGFSANGTLTNGKVALKELAVPIENVAAEFSATTETVDLKNLTLSIAGGQVKSQAIVRDFLTDPKFDLEKKITDVSIGDLIDQSAQPAKFSGKLSGQFKGTGQGKTPDALQTSLVGNGAWSVAEGKLMNLNVLKTVLSKISMIPGLVEKVEQNLPEKYKEVLNRQDTLLSKIEVESSVQSGRINLSKAQIMGEGFALAAEGSVGFDQTVALNAAMFIPEDLAAAMIAAVPELDYVKEESGRIRIPVEISGKANALVIAPDLDYLGKRLIVNKGREELNKVLNKVLGGEEESAPQGSVPGDARPAGAEGNAPTDASAPADDQPLEKKLLNNVLDSIFK